MIDKSGYDHKWTGTIILNTIRDLVMKLRYRPLTKLLLTVPLSRRALLRAV